VAGIIIEGPDGSGKTSLIRHLLHTFRWPVCHVVQPGIPNVEQMAWLAQSGPMIFDRFHWSPVIYGEVLRRGPELDGHDWWMLEGLLLARGYVTVLCVTEIDEMLRNNENEVQLWDSVREYQVVYDLAVEYSRLQDASKLPTLTYNYRCQTPEQIVPWLNEHVRNPAPVGILGSPRPAVWLVGDRRSCSDIYTEHLPFYTSRHFANRTKGLSTAGLYLNCAMDMVGLTWDKVALSNSCGYDLSYMYSDLGRPKVIALGQAASNRLKKSGIEHSRVPHPQYYRRFYHRQVAEYGRLIAEEIVR